MIQIFIFGSSSAYGVGAQDSGWADLLKRRIQEKLYGFSGIGEKCEVFNFAKSGAKIKFAQDNFSNLLADYKRDGKTIALVNIGGNNAKAEDEPGNFVSTVEDFTAQISQFLTELKGGVDYVFFVGSGYVDEAKTSPKLSPFSGRKSFFTNERRALFEKALRDVCDKVGVTFIDHGIGEAEWKEKYLYVDGLHPNQAGHQLIFEKVWIHVEPLLD